MHPHLDERPLRLTPTLVELLALLTVGLVSVVMVFFVGSHWQLQLTAEEMVLAGLTVALLACTVVVWRRSPYARAAALIGLVLCLLTAPPLMGLTLLSAVPLALLIFDRHAFPEANLLRRRPTVPRSYHH